MSTALPSNIGTPQPNNLHSSPSFTPAQAQLQQQQIYAQNVFRQRQFIVQKQWQQHMFQQPQNLQQYMQQQLQRQISQQGKLNQQANGQAVLTLLQFAEKLNPGEEEAVDRIFWDEFMGAFFANQSILKWGLYNSRDNEQRSYEVSQALIPRFFHTLYMNGVSSIQMTIDKSKEYMLPNGYMHVECARASIISKYKNGTLVISKGPLWAQFVSKNGGLKISYMEFSCSSHEEYISRGNIKLDTKKKSQSNLPESFINEWGLPPLAFHILQLGDTALKASEIMFHSIVSGSTPKDSLGAIALGKQPTMLEEMSPIVKTQTTGKRPVNNDTTSPVAKKKNARK